MRSAAVYLLMSLCIAISYGRPISSNPTPIKPVTFDPISACIILLIILTTAIGICAKNKIVIDEPKSVCTDLKTQTAGTTSCGAGKDTLDGIPEIVHYEAPIDPNDKNVVTPSPMTQNENVNFTAGTTTNSAKTL